MTGKQLSILIVLASIAAGLAWDTFCACTGRLDDSWCDAFRGLNKSSAGLLGLCYIALGVHLLCVQWFPAAWGGPR